MSNNKRDLSHLKGAERDQAMDALMLEEFTTEEGKARRKKNMRKFFVIMLVLTICMSFLKWGLVSNWGDVKIERLTLVGHDGADYSALIYIPSNATDATPAPALLCFHGNAGNARNHESWAVEFARRGFVVLSVDQFGAGDSQNFLEPADWLSISALNSVGDVFYQYIKTATFVDQNNIISSGHSMGHCAAAALGAKYNARAIIAVSNPSATTRLYSRFDTDEAKEIVSTIENYTGGFLNLTGLVETTESDFAKAQGEFLQKRPGYEDLTDYEVGKVYGSFEDGTAWCTILEPHRIHEAAFVSSKTITNLLWFGQQIVETVPNPLPDTDQIWFTNDIVGLISILVFGLFICSIALLLIEEIPAFAIVKRPVARNIGLRKQGMAISLILCILFPWIVLKTNGLGVTKLLGTSAVSTPGFRLTFANVSFGVVIGLNVLGILGFLLYYFTEGKKHKLNKSDLGLTPADSNKLSGKMILMTLLLAAIVVAIAWAYILLQEQIFGTDFYAWFFGFKNIPIHKVGYYWWYIIIWILCFVIASFTINVERRLPSTGKEWLDTVLQMCFNVVAATFTLVIVIAVKWELQSQGNDNYWILTFLSDTQRIWGMPAGMAVGIGGSTLLYRKTGNTWLSAMLMGTVAALMCVTFGQVRAHF